MSIENPLWGAPRIHGELLKLGFEVAQSSVAKYMGKRRGPQTRGWRTFLRNHAPEVAVMDLFAVPTICFDLLHAFIIIRLDRRNLVWFKIEHPIVLAPMAGAVNANLAIAVAEGGGLGSPPVALLNEQQMRSRCDAQADEREFFRAQAKGELPFRFARAGSAQTRQSRGLCGDELGDHRCRGALAGEAGRTRLPSFRH